VVEFLCLPRKEASKGKGRRLTMLKVVIGVEKTNSKTTTLHPKLPKSNLTLHFLLENLSLKSKTKLRVFKESRNNYPHYRCP
jgi:hypothetical protein